MWAAVTVAATIAAILALKTELADPIRLELRLPALALPDPNQALLPGSGGGPVLLVVLDNAPAARPQAGLADASLVYVVPTEARITRFLAAYGVHSPGVIGPVRSARRSMLDIASDLGAILVHAGQSGEALTLIRNRRIAVINEFWTAEAFWRERYRPMPHNVFTGLDRLRAALEKRPMDARRRAPPYTFAYQGLTVTPDAAPATLLTLDYGPPYGVRYVYDASRRRYLREQDNSPHLDADGRQIAAGSVLTLFVHWWDEFIRGQPSSRIRLVGSGRLVVAAEGRTVEGTWTRLEGGPMWLKDREGRDLVLPPGPVWVELLPEGRRLAVQVEADR